jgi:hypothetical protein
MVVWAIVAGAANTRSASTGVPEGELNRIGGLSR